jgi:hypothetical protein
VSQLPLVTLPRRQAHFSSRACQPVPAALSPDPAGAADIASRAAGRGSRGDQRTAAAQAPLARRLLGTAPGRGLDRRSRRGLGRVSIKPESRESVPRGRGGHCGDRRARHRRRRGRGGLRCPGPCCPLLLPLPGGQQAQSSRGKHGPVLRGEGSRPGLQAVTHVSCPSLSGPCRRRPAGLHCRDPGQGAAPGGCIPLQRFVTRPIADLTCRIAFGCGSGATRSTSRCPCRSHRPGPRDPEGGGLQACLAGASAGHPSGICWGSPGLAMPAIHRPHIRHRATLRPPVSALSRSSQAEKPHVTGLPLCCDRY